MYELTNRQMVFYGIDKAGIGQAAVLCGSMILSQKVPVEKMQREANALFRMNDSMRARFVEIDGKVFQEFIPYAERVFDVMRFESKEALDAWCAVYATIPLKLDIRSEGAGVPKRMWKKNGTSPALIKNVILHKAATALKKWRYGIKTPRACCEVKLFQLPEASGVILKMHHVVSDAWTMLLVANQFLMLLKGESPRAYQYEEFVRSQEEYGISRRAQRDQAFFAQQYERCPEATLVWPQSLTNLTAARTTRSMDQDLTSRIRAYAAGHGISPYILFLTAVGVFAWRRLKRDLFYVGSVVIGRTGIREKNTAGLFVNAVPLLMAFQQDESFGETVLRVRDANFSCFRHEKGNSDNTIYKLLYDLWISYQDATLEADDTVELTQYYCNYTGTMKVFTVEDRAKEGRFKLHFDHNLLIPEADVNELFRVVMDVLQKGIEDDSRKIGELGK